MQIAFFYFSISLQLLFFNQLHQKIKYICHVCKYFLYALLYVPFFLPKYVNHKSA